MHLTFMKLGLPGSKAEKVIFERLSKGAKRTKYQLQLDLKTSNSVKS